MKKVTYTSCCLLLLSMFTISGLFAQTVVNMPFNTGVFNTFTIAPPTTCSFNFFDNGGSAANYSNTSNPTLSVVTFAPSNPATHRIRATFTAFQTEGTFDALYVYNGNVAETPNIVNAAITTVLPNQFNSGSGIGATFRAGGYQGAIALGPFNATMPSGALTFQFDSDFSVVFAGWSAVIAQVPIVPCGMIPPPNQSVSTDPTTCSATVTTAFPTFNPAGCQTTLNLSYQIDGNTPVLVPQPLPPSFSFPVPKGVHTITWRLTDPCGGAVVSMATQTITVVDLVPPVITCPANINVILDPGACAANIGFTVTATDNCPFLVPVLFTQNPPVLNPDQPLAFNSSLSCFAPPNFYGRVFGGLTAEPLTITGLYVGLNGGVNPAGNFMFNIYRLTSGSTPAPGNANFQLLGGPFAHAMPNAPQTYQTVTFATPVNVPAGSYYFVEIITPGAFQMGNILAPDLPGTPSYMAGCVGSYTTFAAIGFPNNSLAFSVIGFEGGEPEIIQTAGLPSGSSFPIGTTTNCFVVADVAGNTATCCFDITVDEFPFASSTLACNDNIQVSLDSTCTAIIDASMVLSGDVYGCYDDYIVEMQINGNWVPAIVNSSHIGQTIVVRVTDPETGNSCWGTMTIEDKLPPTIICSPVTIICGEALPTEPDPPISGVQSIIYSGLNDFFDDQNPLAYSFPFNFPANTTVLDADVRVDLTHTWTADVRITLTSPSGTSVSIFDAPGCIPEFPVIGTFDDEGAVIQFCDQLDDDINMQPLQAGFPGTYLSQFDGEEAGGVWTIDVVDQAGLDAGTVFEIGLLLDVVHTSIDPTDNCGEVDLTFTDEESGDPCEGLIITRHWVATDGSGNSAECDQIITVLPLDLDSVTCPVAYVGHCGDDTDPSNTGWPQVSGNDITDENNICNIFVGYWDKELNDCGGGVKIVRTWTILDWCTQTTFECVQVIKLTDDEAPILDCPSDLTVGTDFWYCFANVSVPKPDVFDECGSAFVLSLSSSAGVIVNFGNNYVINQLPLGTHTVTWTATDECGNAATCTFTITVVDDVVPVANCDEHTVVALTNDGPFGVTLVPAHVFDDGSYDNCGPVTFRVRRMDSCIDFDWTTEGACIDHIPGGVPPVNSRDRGTVSRPCVPFACCDVGAGPIMVELEVTDASGNRNFCMVEAIVQDKISPFVECPPDITVSCDFWFNVEEGTFGDSPADHGGNGNGNLDEDPLSAIFGNMFDAFAYNDDESVRQDIIINDPGNPQVNQPHFWGIDGWADDNCQVLLQVRVRVIDDCSGGELPPGAPAGAVKLIERRFSASDGNEGIAPGTCTQRIWVVDFEPFFITDQTCNDPNPNDGVIWPCDVTLHDCPEDLGDTGEPEVFDDACSLIGVAYEDTRFDFVDGACFKILRKWSIIDWCQYDPLTGEGIWHYIQVIKVHDEEGPIFLTCPGNEPVVLCVADTGVSLPNNNQAFLGEGNPLASSCSAHLNLCQTVHETCSDFITYDVKFYMNNGDEFIYVKPTTVTPTDSNHNAQLCFDTRENSSFVIRNNGIPYNSPFCGDYHRILWSAEDGCGNWSHCEYLIRLEDCKQPSPVCINGLSTVVMPVGGQVTVWAKDFDASSFDDCTPAADLLFSFSGDNYQPSFTYTCDNVPAFGVELSVNIWVADGGTDDNCNDQISWDERNKDFCTTTIVITDNAGVCPDTSGSLLAGEILTDEDLQAVELVAVTLTNPNHVFPTYVTVENGKYSFFIAVAGENTVTPQRNDAHKNGVSTLDLVRIQKHLLGIEAINNPYDLIAADANNSQGVSAIDLIELRKLILGIYSELPANKSWRFVDKDFEFADPTHPWPFAEQITVSDMSTNHLDENFVAVKVGDVNNTVQANANQIMPRNGNGVVNFVANDRMVNAGEMVEVAISSTDFASIEGYQFTMQTEGLEFRGVDAGVVSMSDENMGVFGSTLTASWHKVGGVSATSSDVLFTLRFQATAAGKLSSMITLNSRETEAEAYNTLEDIKDLKLTFRGAEHGAEFALYQNEPNPFKGNTMIGYDLPVAGKVTLTLFDVTGKVLLVKSQDSVKGYNTISVSSKDMPSVGVLYYRLDANEYTATKKMVIIE